MRRPCFALATAAVLGAFAAETLLAGLGPAMAATTSPARPASRAQAGQSPVGVTITGMTPQWATSKATVTVTGTVTNMSRQSITDLSVQLDASSSQFSSASVLESYLARPYQLTGSPVTRLQPISSALKPGQSARWTLSFRATAAGLTRFGVYPLTAQVSADVGGLGAAALNYAYTFLPYVPAKRSHFAKSVPAPKPISLVWPLIDYPLIGLPGRRICSGSQVAALAASVSPGGRLADLLAAGARYAQQLQLTWAIDPALLEDVRSLSRCEHAPGVARAAATWLAGLRTATRNQPLFVTPYADVELSLIGQHHSADVGRAFQIGRALAGQILDRNLGAGSDDPAAGGSPPITSAAWPPSGSADFPTMETLAATANVQTLLLDDSSVSAGPGNAFVTWNGVGFATHVLLYSHSLSQTLSAATAAPGSAFAAAQDYLAQTALLAQSRSPAAIIVAPPQRWNPPAGLAATMLAAAARAPWLRAAPLSTLEQHVTSRLTLPASSANPARFSRRVAHEFGVIDGLIDQIAAIQAADQHFYLASMALESSAWHTMSRAAQLAQIHPLVSYMQAQQQGISLVVANRVTLGGLKGNVPVVVDNRLGYPVTVRLSVRWQQPPGGGLKVFPPTGTITVPANGQEPVRIRIEAAQVGSTTLSVRLLTRAGKPLSAKLAVGSVTVQATQFGNVAMIILASVLGVFVIGSAIRGARRRDQAPPDDPGDPGQLDPDADHESQNGSETDTVVPERSELGTAGTSGL